MFATERLGTRRVICMGDGLKRLGLTEHERMFTTIHAQCDDHHAGDWLERVILPSTIADEDLRERIASGVVACLETSRDYLDYLSNRAISERLAAASCINLLAAQLRSRGTPHLAREIYFIFEAPQIDQEILNRLIPLLAIFA